MNVLIEEAIDYIEKNRASTVEVSDALGKKGAVDDVSALNAGEYAVGEIFYAATWGGSNWNLHKDIIDAPKNSVVFIDCFDCKDAVLGDVVAKYLFLYCGISALVVNGKVRDVHRLLKEGYPIWCAGVSPVGCVNEYAELDSETEKELKKRKIMYNKSIAICDDSGVCIVERNKIDEDFLEKLEFIEAQEDVWYYCLDVLKQNTFEIICEKKYLNDKNIIPNELYRRLKSKNDE